jgi:protein-disulfide isomerase
MEEESHEIGKKEETHSALSHHRESLTNKMRENPWVLATVVLGILSLILIIGSFSGGKTLSKSAAGQAILNFAESQVDGEVSLGEIEDYGDNLYQVTLNLDGQDIPLYITKDGKNLVQGVLPLSSGAGSGGSSSSNSNSQSTEIPKSDKPLVELFVMTHCPYGTQAEKGIIPTIKALGNTVDATKIRFVHYFMHGDKEEAETYNQVCIREEQSDKYLDYLACFLEDSDSARCIDKVKIDKIKLEKCISSDGKAKEYYAEDSKLSKGYGVQGSPTLIINGKQSDAGRDSASYLEGICSAFNNAPEVCKTELSSDSPSPGFGYGASGSSGSAAQCA